MIDHDIRWNSLFVSLEKIIKLLTPHLYIPEPPKTEREQLNELLYSVETKIPGESRFDTALRYIREAENKIDCGASKESRDGK